jgi:adenosine deaminase
MATAKAPAGSGGPNGPAAPTRETLVAAPKVLLHDHLDGGVRPQTVVEIAERDRVCRTLPATDPQALARGSVESADSGSLVRYLETFAQTVAVMQTEAWAASDR